MQPLQAGLEALRGLAEVQRVGLSGDYLRVIGRDLQPQAMRQVCASAQVTVQAIKPDELTLEDAFLALAQK